MWRVAIVMLCLLPLQSSAQVKFEREYRLKPDAVPQAARSFVEAADFSGKVRWYAEESQRGRSFEAKVKERGLRYSIEFDTLGRIEDVEVEADWERVERVVRDSICDYLARNFDRYRIQRVQLQWTSPSEATLIELIRLGTTSRPYTYRYEVIARGSARGETEAYELLFSAAGTLERRSRILSRNTDNLDY